MWQISPPQPIRCLCQAETRPPTSAARDAARVSSATRSHHSARKPRLFLYLHVMNIMIPPPPMFFSTFLFVVLSGSCGVETSSQTRVSCVHPSSNRNLGAPLKPWRNTTSRLWAVAEHFNLHTVPTRTALGLYNHLSAVNMKLCVFLAHFNEILCKIKLVFFFFFYKSRSEICLLLWNFFSFSKWTAVIKAVWFIRLGINWSHNFL